MTRQSFALAALTFAIALATSAAAQPAPAPANPCAAIGALPADVSAYLAEAARARAEHRTPPAIPAEAMATYTAWQKKTQAEDFPGRCYYDAANAKLPPATPNRVVYFGDSITQLWGAVDPGRFAGETINRGISGQTTAQMIGRYQQDVVALKPRVVHILAGINDLAGNTGPSSAEWVEANLRTLVEVAKANHIRVVVASVLPADRISWRPEIKPAPDIAAINAWLKRYAAEQGLVYVDYVSALDDGHGGFNPTLTTDGVHPNAAGYAVMRPLADAAIAQALKRR